MRPTPSSRLRTGMSALEFVRRKYGERLVLFGNIELSDIESMEPAEFERLVGADPPRRHSRAGQGLRPDALRRPERPADHAANDEELRDDGAPGRESPVAWACCPSLGRCLCWVLDRLHAKSPASGIHERRRTSGTPDAVLWQGVHGVASNTRPRKASARTYVPRLPTE